MIKKLFLIFALSKGYFIDESRLVTDHEIKIFGDTKTDAYMENQCSDKYFLCETLTPRYNAVHCRLEKFQISNFQFMFFFLNSQAGGMAVARPYGFEIDFVSNPISGSAA